MADPIWPINGKNSVFFLNFNRELWAIVRSCKNSATAVRNYICRATWWAIVPIYPPMLQWNMADPIWPINCKKCCFFFNFNHELWAIGRSCQNSATAVRNYICRATWWAIVPFYPPMLQWNMADPIWPINGKTVFFFLNFNHELWAIGRSCQNSATAVRNYISRTTCWAIVPI